LVIYPTGLRRKFPISIDPIVLIGDQLQWRVSFSSREASASPLLYREHATSGSEEPRRLKPALQTLAFLLLDLCDPTAILRERRAGF